MVNAHYYRIVVTLTSLYCLLHTSSAYFQQQDEQSYSYNGENDVGGGGGDYGDYQYVEDTLQYVNPPSYRRPRYRSRRRGMRYNRHRYQKSYQGDVGGGDHDEGYNEADQTYGNTDSYANTADSYADTDSYGGGGGSNAQYGAGDYEDYTPQRQQYARSGRGRSAYSMTDMYGRSGTYGYNKPKKNKYVPVIIKQKKKKKRKIISISNGFYIPGGTAVFGKFKDLISCEKACALTPTCFAGDYNPWLGKCYLHSNITACQSQKAHKQITHFKKVPCAVVETPRGLITLGTGIYGGLQQKNVKSLMQCVKECATAGGGIAPTPATAVTTPQLCFGIDYNFASHKCYFHTAIAVCGGDADTNSPPLTPVLLVAQPSVVNILLCPVGV